MAEVEKWFAEIDEAITKYKGAKANDFDTQQSNSILIVNNLISILKSDPKNENTDLLGKVNQIVDKASEIDNGRIWGYAYMEKECDLLLDFLKELVERKCMDKVDQIFHCGEKPYPIVNFISRILRKNSILFSKHSLKTTKKNSKLKLSLFKMVIKRLKSLYLVDMLHQKYN